MSNNNKKVCPYCGEEINELAKKCKYCGEWLIEENDSINASKFCQFCGTVIPKSAEKCPKCGEWLVREEDSRYEQGDASVVSKFIWSLMGILAFLTIFFSDSFGTFIFLLFLYVCLGIFLEIYLIPTRIALNNRHTNIFLVVVLNVFLGETIIGWIIALAYATMQRRGRNSIL